MKISSVAKSTFAIGLISLTNSCDNPKQPQGKVQRQLTTEELAREAEFGPWMSKAGLMFAQEQVPVGDYFAVIEGRVNKGENQYRAIQRKLDAEKYSDAEGLWGLEAEPLCQYEVALLRSGMERSSSQVFTDSTGKAIHQLVMVLPVGAEAAEGGRTDLASLESKLIPSALESRLEASTPPSPPLGLTEAEIGSEASEALAGSADSSVDAIVVSPEVAPLDEVSGEGGDAVGSEPEPDMTNAPDPTTTEEEAGEAASEVGVVFGELETPEPALESEVADELEAPGLAVVVEDDENAPETEEDLTPEPDPTPETDSTPTVADEPEPAPLSEFITYKVVRGDTLSGLSRRYKVSISAIKKATGFRSDMLRIGQTLKIPTK